MPSAVLFNTVAVAASGGAVAGLTLPSAAQLALSGPVSYCIITNNTANDCNWRDDGTAVTGAVGGGMLLPGKGVMKYDGSFSKIGFLSTSASTTTLGVSWYA